MPFKDASVASLMQMLHGAVALGLFQSTEAEHEWRVIRYRPTKSQTAGPVISHGVCLRWACAGLDKAVQSVDRSNKLPHASGRALYLY
jgi:hypothetical protein